MPNTVVGEGWDEQTAMKKHFLDKNYPFHAKQLETKIAILSVLLKPPTAQRKGVHNKLKK